MGPEELSNIFPMVKRKKQTRRKKRTFNEKKQFLTEVRTGTNKALNRALNKKGGFQKFLGKKVLPTLINLERNAIGNIPIVGKALKKLVFDPKK